MLNIAQNIESITESSIDRQARDVQFIANLIEQNREMERFVNESLILASGNKRAIQEMAIFNEAAAGDRIKGFFQKIKDFFKKIFTKLGASLSAVFAEQKKYCEQYAYIITKCKWQAGDVNDIKNYFVGIPRIIDMVDNNIETALFGQLQNKNFLGDGTRTNNINAETLNNPPAKEDVNKVKTDTFNDFVKGQYWTGKGLTAETDSNGVVDIDKTFRTYFDGAADTISVSGDEIESKYMQLIINTVYAGQSYLNKLEKIVGSVDKKMDEIQKSSEAELKQIESKLNEAAKKDQQQTQQNQNTNQNQNSQEQNQSQNSNQQQNQDNSKTVRIDTINNLNPNPDGTYSYGGVTSSSKNQLKNDLNRLGWKLESVVYSSGEFVNEFNLSNSSSNTTADDNNKAAKNLTGTGTANVTAAGKANTAVTGQKVKAGEANVSGNVEEGKVKTYMDNLIHNQQAEVNAMVQCTSAIARAAFGAYKSANSDFFKIIQAHVQWYLSNPGSEKASENQTTRGKNLDLNGGLTNGTEKPADNSATNNNATS